MFFFRFSLLGIFLLVFQPVLTAAEGSNRQGASQLVFLAVGDQGSGDHNQRRVAQAMERVARQGDGIDFVLLLGDNIYEEGVESVDDRQWRDKFEAIYTGATLSKTPFFAILGNHDALGNRRAQIDYAKRGSGRWHMDSFYYFRDFGRIGQRPLLRVVFLDTTGDDFSKAAQVGLLKRAFQNKADGPLWKVVAGHHPLRSNGPHRIKPTISSWFNPVLISTGVDLYLCGHDHNLQMIQPPGEPLYVVSGAGGRRLYQMNQRDPHSRFAVSRHGFMKVTVNARQMIIDAHDDHARRLHRLTLNKPDER